MHASVLGTRQVGQEHLRLVHARRQTLNLLQTLRGMQRAALRSLRRAGWAAAWATSQTLQSPDPKGHAPCSPPFSAPGRLGSSMEASLPAIAAA